MDNVHGTHGTTRVVKHPFLIQVDKTRRGSSTVKLVDNVAHDAARVVAMRGNAAFGQIVQMIRLKDVEGLKALLEKVKDWAQEAYEDGQEGEYTCHFWMLPL